MRLLYFFLICIVLAPVSAPGQGLVEHFAGPPPSGGYHDGFAVTATFSGPAGTWSDGASLYIADTGNNRIRRMELVSGQVTTIAGKESGTFTRPWAIWGDGQSLYLTDAAVIRKTDVFSGAVSVFVPEWTRQDIPRVFAYPLPYALAGNSSKLYVFYSSPLVGSSFLPDGPLSIREISLATGEPSTIPASAYGGVMPTGCWADDQFVYFLYSGGAVGRMDVMTYEFQPLFGDPAAQQPSLNAINTHLGEMRQDICDSHDHSARDSHDHSPTPVACC